MSSQTLNIGGVATQIISSDQKLINKISSKYRNFLLKGRCKAHFKLNLEHDSWPDDTDNIAVREKGNTYVIQGEKFKCAFDLDGKKARLKIFNELSHFNTFLRVFYSQTLLSYNGFMVHAAGLLRKDNAYLFTGPSEAGKTTTANQAIGFEVLSDELVIVREVNDLFYLYSTPFSGDYSKEVKNLCAPLRNVFFLNKNLSTNFKSKNRLRSLIDLLANVFFFDRGIDSNQTILQLCSKLTDSISSGEVNILKNNDLGGFVDGFS